MIDFLSFHTLLNMKNKSTRYLHILKYLPDTIAWSHTLNLDNIRDFLTCNDELPRIFLGSGGSLSAAFLAMELSVERGMMAVAMTPYQYIGSHWSRLPAKVMLFSAGGRNVDAINAYKIAAENPNQQFGALLMSRSTPIEIMIAESGAGKSFVFHFKRRDGFLATNSLAAFYSILFRIYRNDTVNIEDPSVATSVRETVHKFITESYSLSTEGWDSHNAALYEARETDRFYALYSPEVLPIAIDLESRFSEGSIGCLQISDYRNFAHGRFNWFHQRKGQTAIIALITPEGKNVAEKILNELPEYISVLRLSTQQKGSAGLMELLLKGMFLSNYLGIRWGLDIGAPDVADFGRRIHNLDFLESSPDN